MPSEAVCFVVGLAQQASGPNEAESEGRLFASLQRRNQKKPQPITLAIAVFLRRQQEASSRTGSP